MQHHIICNIDVDDDYKVEPSRDSRVHRIALQRPGDRQSVRTSFGDQCQDLGIVPTLAAMDLFHLACAVYSADTGILRKGAYDGWTRYFTLHAPVHDLALWQPEQNLLAELLGFLTGDHWELHLRPMTPPSKPIPPVQATTTIEGVSGVSLFSGGLDSFIGAIDRLEADEKIVLVSHYGAGTTNAVQDRVFAALKSQYEDLPIRFGCFVQPSPPAMKAAEKTTRSRSILFLALGTAIASGLGKRSPLFVPENGLISLNPALTNSRLGSLSTRTTHPYFLALYRRLLEKLGIDVGIETPYRFMTKGKMVSGVLNRGPFREGVAHTVSCSHPDVGRYQGASPGQHCGYCVPCIIRRAALHAAGIDSPEQYLNDVLADALPGTTGLDYRAFQMAAERFEGSNRSRLLFDVLSTGPIAPEDTSLSLDVYRKGMMEVQSFLQQTSPVPV